MKGFDTMKVQYIKQNQKDKMGHNLEIGFAGGYIANILKYDTPQDTRSYISICLKVLDSTTDETESLMIMVPKKSYGRPNINIELITDAFEKQVPVAVVFYQSPKAKFLQFCYTNFSSKKSEDLDDFFELDDTEDLPFD